MVISLNPHISVDCVIFGFDGQNLKVLLVKPENFNANELLKNKLKLPGNLIRYGEPLYLSASRTLNELTSLDDIYLKQFGVFDDPGRLNPPEDLDWLRESTKLDVKRVITIAYYSLIKIEESMDTSSEGRIIWEDPFKLPGLIFDHAGIIEEGLNTLQQELLTEPLAYELLPEKFTLNQLQKIYEVILQLNIDNRNFRKKISRLDYIIPLNEKQKGVSNRPAQLHTFDQDKFAEFKKNFKGFII